jgi:hypothetical protein
MFGGHARANCPESSQECRIRLFEQMARAIVDQQPVWRRNSLESGSKVDRIAHELRIRRLDAGIDHEGIAVGHRDPCARRDVVVQGREKFVQKGSGNSDQIRSAADYALVLVSSGVRIVEHGEDAVSGEPNQKAAVFQDDVPALPIDPGHGMDKIGRTCFADEGRVRLDVRHHEAQLLELLPDPKECLKVGGSRRLLASLM